jgi:hypothetical protein
MNAKERQTSSEESSGPIAQKRMSEEGMTLLFGRDRDDVDD